MGSDDASTYLGKLNDQQREAVEHGDDGDDRPLLVLAGAGSGKTNTLAHRVAHRVVKGADPNRMLLLTFSRRAAQEMSRRAEAIVAKATNCSLRLPWAGTFHAIGARLLREFAVHLGIEPRFSIADRGDAADLMNLVRNDLGFADKASRFPMKATCLSVYSRVVNTQGSIDEILRNDFPKFRHWQEELRALFAAYVDAKHAQAILDYDDLLLYWAQAMLVPAVAQAVSEKFDDIFVDEYQDTNSLQAAILHGLRPSGKNLTVVGDDSQSIYSFRAATVRNILDFPGQFANEARVALLEQNYRSTRPILDASNAVIGLALERFTKNLWSDKPEGEKPSIVVVEDETAQAEFIVERVLANRESGQALKDQAVLFRAGDHSDRLELELTRKNIPFVKFGGLKFLEASHVKDILAILRWATNHKDSVAAFRVLLLFPGVGPATARKLVDKLAQVDDPTHVLARFKAPAAAGQQWREFCSTYSGLRRQVSGWPSELEAVARWYAPLLQEQYEDAHVREADLQQLVQIANGYASREQFLTDLTLDPPDAMSDEAGVPSKDDDYLILSTIHSAKGQEWRSVFVLNIVDGCIPSDLGTGEQDDIEEERRLLYVAMTRAKTSLHLVQPRRFYTHNQHRLGDRHVTATRTRFIPTSILDHFQQEYWPARRSLNEVTQAISEKPMVDLKDRVKAMWR
ncbi:ATP-dependent helicase [Dongia sp.]|uniref:ATP-dependent helicase n=1 Tax=Dongia sp. TaxID=1977262 RepID=UPI0035AEDEA3